MSDILSNMTSDISSESKLKKVGVSVSMEDMGMVTLSQVIVSFFKSIINPHSFIRSPPRIIS